MRVRRGRRGGAAIAAEGRSESSSDLTAAEVWRRLLLGFGPSHRGTWGYALGQGLRRAGPRDGGRLVPEMISKRDKNCYISFLLQK